MAKEAKKDPNELSVEEKLKALYQLQTMLSEIDKIKTLRGELPLEVQDLEDEVTGLSTRIEKIKAEIEELKSNVASKKIEIETAKASIEKYKSQQDNVRNNREYDVLTKEIEFQSLEVELCEKRIREYTAGIKSKEEEIVKQALKALTLRRCITDKELAADNINHLFLIVVLHINSTIKRKSSHLSFLITDDCNVIIKGHIFLNIPADNLLHCFQTVVDYNFLRVLFRFYQENFNLRIIHRSSFLSCIFLL